MKVAIRAVSKHNIALKSLLNLPEIEVAFFADSDPAKWYQQESGATVISSGTAYKLYKAGEVDKFFLSPHLPIAGKLITEMIEAGVAEEDICIPSVTRLATARPFTQKEISNGDLSPRNWHQIRYLEFHIADNCNLNCSGCIHFSSLVSGERFVSLSEVRHDLTRLRKITEHIEEIRILGGEPFLNPDWSEYVEVVKELYPYANLYIATNGLLVKKFKEWQLDFLRKHRVKLAITNYRPLWGEESDLVVKLKEMGVSFSISAPVTSFRSCLQRNGTIDAKLARIQCNAFCFSMYRGRMAPCPIMMYIKDFNNYFGCSYPEDTPINLDEDMDFATFLRKMHQPMPLCAYCNQTKTTLWSRIGNKRARIEYWLADER